MAPKRPTGFGKASKEKKVKKADSPEGEAELNIELQGEIEDEELAEIYGLYSKIQEERDPKIARGLVHECDQLLRARDTQNQDLPPKFHIVYGGALLTLADPAENKEHKEFRDAGVERLNKGIESNDIEALALASLELIQFAHTQISTKTGELSSAGSKLLDYAVKLLKKCSTKQHIELARAAHRLLLLTDELGDEDEAVATAKAVLETQIKSDDSAIQARGHKGMGQYYMSLVSPALDALDGDSDDEADKSADEQLKKDLELALTHLRKGVSDTDQESHVMLAETLLQYAEIIGDETKEEKAYAEALQHLKKARMLGNDGLNDIIDSIENPE